MEHKVCNEPNLGSYLLADQGRCVPKPISVVFLTESNVDLQLFKEINMKDTCEV